MDTEMSVAEHTPIANWDAYANSFSSVMPEQMLRLNRTVASYMDGNVVDFGCGGGKIIPFILTRDSVNTYTGIDSSAQMIERARWVANHYTQSRAQLIHSRIEDVDSIHSDSALSINSYYVWEDSFLVLSHIRRCLSPGTRFVIATINPNINMPALLDDAEKELIAHPHWAEFKEHNLKISVSENANFVSLDTLIGELRDVGFCVQEANSELYGGGLNLVVCSVPHL